jgi:phage FluMu protein Com
MISTNKSNVLNKGRIEFFQSTDYSGSGAKHNYYCSAPEPRTMQLMSTNVKATHMHSKGEKNQAKFILKCPRCHTIRVLQNTGLHDYLSYMQGSSRSEEKLHYPMHAEDWA